MMDHVIVSSFYISVSSPYFAHLRLILLAHTSLDYKFALPIATPTRRPFSGHGGDALSWQSHSHSLAAYLWRHLRQSVLTR